MKKEDDYIWLVYGLKAGEGVYHEDGLLGGTLIAINEDLTYSIERCFQAYEENYSDKKGYREESICW